MVDSMKQDPHIKAASSPASSRTDGGNAMDGGPRKKDVDPGQGVAKGFVEMSDGRAVEARLPQKEKVGRELVASFTSDQLAAVQHTLGAIRRHIDDSAIQSYPEAVNALSQLYRVLDRQRHSIELHIDREFGGKGLEGTIKDALTNVSGFVIGMYGKIRNQKISRMVRDDITAANFLATCYSMLNATALSFGEEKTATLASTLLRDLTPFVIELSRVIPQVVVQELSLDGYAIDRNATEQALENVVFAWSHSNVSHSSSAGNDR